MTVRVDGRSHVLRPTSRTRPGFGRGASLLVSMVLGLVLGLGLVVAPTPAVAQPPADLGTAATVNHGRGANAQTWTVVEVVSSPTRPIAGQLEVRAAGPMGNAAATRDLEVAAGATKVVHLLLPPAHQVQVLFLPADGGDRIELPTGGTRNLGSVLVGGVGEEPPQLPDPLSTAGTDRPVRGIAVDPAVLALGPRALESLDALRIEQAALAALPEADLATLESAVLAGLDLLVAVAPQGAEIPLRWNPVASVAGGGRAFSIEPAAGAWPLRLGDIGIEGDGIAAGEVQGEQVVAAAVTAGKGRVVALGVDSTLGRDPTAQLWRSILQPRAELPTELGGGDEGDIGMRLFGGSTSLPGARGAALFLLAFLVLVGPVNALIVRRLGRRELSWVTIPAIALVFTGVAAATTTGGGQEPSPVVRAAWWLDGVGHEVTAVAVQAPNRGVQQVTFPGIRDAIMHQPWGSIVSTAERAGDATVIGARLEALQGVTALGWGRAPVGPPLDVSATRLDGGELEVSIHNTSGVDLEGVEVKVATHQVEVGRLGAGERTEVAITDLGEFLPASRFNNGRMFAGPPRRAPEDPGAGAAKRLLDWSPLDGSPGIVWVSGHTSDRLGLSQPQVAGGTEDRGSFVAVGVAPDGLDGAGGIEPHLVRRDVLRTDQDWMSWRPEPLALEGQEEVLLRFRLPSPDAVGQLVSSLDRGGPIDQGMHMDPWGEGCFEVTVFDADGEQIGEVEERCGADVSCPMDSEMCSGDDRRIEACFPDGRCQMSVRVGDLPTEAVHDGFEVYDHGSGSWVPATQAFGDGADTSAVLSPFGEVLVRARQVGWFEFAQRGIAVEGGGS